MFMSRYMPCSECGASVERSEEAAHRCDPERLAEFKAFGMRDEVAELETRIKDFLGSPLGQFEAWDAARHVRRTA